MVSYGRKYFGKKDSAEHPKGYALRHVAQGTKAHEMGEPNRKESLEHQGANTISFVLTPRLQVDFLLLPVWFFF